MSEAQAEHGDVYKLKGKYGAMEVSDAHRMRQHEGAKSKATPLARDFKHGNAFEQDESITPEAFVQAQGPSYLTAILSL